MIKHMVCIECPKSCTLSVDIEGCRAVNVKGARCPKGIAYASQEIENPSRILTATVLSDSLSLKLIPVRTDKPIPKKDIFKAMDAINNMRINHPVKTGDVIEDNFLGLGVKLMVTRRVDKY